MFVEFKIGCLRYHNGQHPTGAHNIPPVCQGSQGVGYILKGVMTPNNVIRIQCDDRVFKIVTSVLYVTMLVCNWQRRVLVVAGTFDIQWFL